MRNLDKYIKLNFSYVSNDFGISAVAAASVLLCFLFFHLIPLALFFIIVGIGFLVKSYKKLFYEGIYGERSTMERELPVREEEVIAAKVFTAFIGRIIFEIAMVTALLSASYIGVVNIDYGNDHIENLLCLVPESVEPGQLPIAAVLAVIMIMAQCFCQTSTILVAVMCYNSQPKSRRNFAGKAVAAVAVYLICSVSTGVMKLFGDVHAIIIELVSISISVAIGIAMCRWAVKMLKEQ